MAYGFSWGGFSGTETLDNVQSGIGRVGNYKFIPHVQKSVVRAPSILSSHGKATSNHMETKRVMTALGTFVQKPGVVSFTNLIFAAVLKIDPKIGWGVIGAVSVSAIAAIASLVVVN
ncbi:expressed unknown protein [Seminavis robusta]|uniref:Uncharacterized protein n=1 Tax=Seminavis robusta TaxID=568900 RepID=A0A9N8EIY8_9STRA|nr:expressed unknown protein [Seminavis robusta]|eukprot:Sro1311_g261740.1 n/a (117) ;mRNA; r:6457-6807